MFDDKIAEMEQKLLRMKAARATAQAQATATASGGCNGACSTTPPNNSGMVGAMLAGFLPMLEACFDRIAAKLASAIGKATFPGTSSRGMPCMPDMPRQKLDENGCPTGVRICKRESPAQSVSIAAGATEEIQFVPPDQAIALQFVSAAPAGTWFVSRVEVGSVTLFEGGEMDVASWSQRFRADQSVGWGEFSSNKPVKMTVRNASAGALLSAGVGTLLYYSLE
jgi:hypothetical protein